MTNRLMGSANYIMDAHWYRESTNKKSDIYHEQHPRRFPHSVSYRRTDVYFKLNFFHLDVLSLDRTGPQGNEGDI